MAEESQEVKPKKSKKWLIIALALVVLIAGGGAGAYFMGFFSSAEAAETVEEKPVVEVKTVIGLDPLVINIPDSGSMRYVRIGLSFGVYYEGTVPEIDPEIVLPKLKDYLLTLLGHKSVTELVQPEGKEKLRKEILEGVNKMIPEDKGKVVEVYFTEFIIQ